MLRQDFFKLAISGSAALTLDPELAGNLEGIEGDVSIVVTRIDGEVYALGMKHSQFQEEGQIERGLHWLHRAQHLNLIEHINLPKSF